MIELVLHTSEALAEPLSDALIEEWGALSVALEDADAGSRAECALFDEPGQPARPRGWQRSTLCALFETDAAAQAGAALLLARHQAQGVDIVALRPVPEQDWVRLTQSQFAPVAITPALWIVPSWHEPPAGAGIVIHLDPGLAFGTGTHATTRMCLRWLAGQASAGGGAWPRVLDYGCGSGILGIAAARLGAREVLAVDVDAAALRASQENALRNGVALHAGAPEEARGGYDLVLANILAAPLILLAPLLAGHVQPGGWIVLAGILQRQAEELKCAYAPHIALGVLAHDEGWVLMGGRRTAADVR